MNEFASHMIRQATLAAAVAWVMLLVAHAPVGAAITYVDAAEGPSGNTYAVGGSLSSTSWLNTSITGGDEDQWVKRTGSGLANGDTVLQAYHVADDAGGDDLPTIVTEITGLSPGSTYNIHVFFWDNNQSNNVWQVDAGPTAGSLTLYTSNVGPPAGSAEVGNGGETEGATASVAASSLSFTSSVLTFVAATNDRTMYAADLGELVADGSGQISVFLHNHGQFASYFASTSASSIRTWYDGVGYELVSTAIPTPAALPAGLVLMGVLAMRRK